MDVLFYLTTLIKAHKEVGIPGLGTIYKKKSPGRYDVASHLFLPPRYLIHFTSDLKEDSLLVSQISNEERISADLAIHQIEEFSQRMLDELAEHQTVGFGQLGVFSIETGSLTFTSKKDQYFGFEFYGLPALSAEVAPDQEIQPLFEEALHIEDTLGQLDLENSNLDLGDGAAHREEDVQRPPFIETPENIEPEEELVPEEDPNEEDLNEEENLTLDNGLTEKEPLEKQAPILKIDPQISEESKTYLVEAAANAETTVETEPETEVKPAEDLVENIEPHLDFKDDTPFVFISESAENRSSASSFYVNSVVIPEQKPPAYRQLLIGIVVICALIALAYLLKPELFKAIIQHNVQVTGNAQKQVQKPFVTILADSSPVTDTAAIADSIRISNEKAIAKIDSAKKTVTIPAPAEHSNYTITFEILAASLANQKEADNFLAEMKKRGIHAKVADLKGRRVKITLGTFTDEREARRQLEILKETTKLPDIYIFTNRHTKQH